MRFRLRTWLQRLALVGAGIGLAGCVTTQRVLRERGEGEVRCYLGPFEEMWAAAEEGIRRVGLVIEVADTAQGALMARNYEPEVLDPEQMAVDADAGERVGVFLERAGAGLWAVEVVSRRIFPLDISARDWTPDVFLALEAQLPDSAKAATPEIAECERQRRSATPAPPPGDRPSGLSRGLSGRQRPTSNSRRSIPPSGASAVGGESRAYSRVWCSTERTAVHRLTRRPPNRCSPPRVAIGVATPGSARPPGTRPSKARGRPA